MKFILMVSLFIVTAYGKSDIGLQFRGVETTHTTLKGKQVKMLVERYIPSECLNVPVNNEQLRSGMYASAQVPSSCKKTFVTTAGGVVFPMKIHPDVETYGEIEVLAFLKKMQRNPALLLIDSRGEEWFEYNTIPGAISMHYHYLTEPEAFPHEFEASLTKLGVTKSNNHYDFSHAKTIALFCNGAWCAQSPNMIKALLKLGYPAQKIKWYRGGMDDWLGLSMTSTHPSD
ncbi:MAG TPA: rhodanese-like domain-containing protein [Epsilonproteobacteria bacterium]|nr:rhodanese-like domain-containing protein [Campylobacterota bacterium]